MTNLKVIKGDVPEMTDDEIISKVRALTQPEQQLLLQLLEASIAEDEKTRIQRKRSLRMVQ